MVLTSKQIPHISNGEFRHWAVSYKDVLNTGEVLSSSTTQEITTADLTITSTVNTSAHTISGVSCTSGQAVIGTVTGQSANTKYRLRVTAVTDASQTLVQDITFWAD